MRRLFLLLYNYRATLLFIFLELLCAWMIVTQNLFLSASFFNSSNSTVASVLSTSNSVQGYFRLGDVNTSLAEENAKLRKQVKTYEQSLYRLDTRLIKDQDLLGQYDFLTAKVINNSTRKVHNYLTINAGEKRGVKTGMGVINRNGVVGKVVSTSSNYAVVASLLNADVMISSKIKRTQHLGTVNWSGRNSQQANLLFIPRHTKPILGDTIVSSGYNAVFPEGAMIGVISDIDLSEKEPFYEIEVSLANNFSELSYVYVISNELKEEQHTTENIVLDE